VSRDAYVMFLVRTEPNAEGLPLARTAYDPLRQSLTTPQHWPHQASSRNSIVGRLLHMDAAALPQDLRHKQPHGGNNEALAKALHTQGQHHVPECKPEQLLCEPQRKEQQQQQESVLSAATSEQRQMNSRAVRKRWGEDCAVTDCTHQGPHATDYATPKHSKVTLTCDKVRGHALTSTCSSKGQHQVGFNRSLPDWSPTLRTGRVRQLTRRYGWVERNIKLRPCCFELFDDKRGCWNAFELSQAKVRCWEGDGAQPFQWKLVLPTNQCLLFSVNSERDRQGWLVALRKASNNTAPH